MFRLRRDGKLTGPVLTFKQVQETILENKEFRYDMGDVIDLLHACKTGEWISLDDSDYEVFVRID